MFLYPVSLVYYVIVPYPGASVREKILKKRASAWNAAFHPEPAPENQLPESDVSPLMVRSPPPLRRGDESRPFPPLDK